MHCIEPKLFIFLIPDFILEELSFLNPITKPMFGCRAVYVNEKIVLILRKRVDYIQDNGVWIATSIEHHKSLLRVFPSMRSLTVFGSGLTSWQVIQEEADDFEESALKLCQLIQNADPRIGKIPKPKKQSKKTTISKHKKVINKKIIKE